MAKSPHAADYTRTMESICEALRFMEGSSGKVMADLARDYRTQVDPRLDCEQAVEMALVLARLVSRTSR